MGAEVYAFADSFDLANALRVDLESTVGSKYTAPYIHRFEESVSRDYQEFVHFGKWLNY